MEYLTRVDTVEGLYNTRTNAVVIVHSGILHAIAQCSGRSIAQGFGGHLDEAGKKPRAKGVSERSFFIGRRVITPTYLFSKQTCVIRRNAR